MAFSLMHWLVLLVFWAAWIVPLYRILGRIGWPRAVAFVALVPPLAVVLLWAMAFGRWAPTDR